MAPSRFLLPVVLCAAVNLGGLASARPVPDQAERPRPLLVEYPAQASPLTGRGLASGLYSDTTYYGGTVWAPDSMRWEAIRGGTWTFQSGVGSSIVTQAGGCKPVGYHQTMEGWTGLDQTFEPLPFFRRSTICPINGNYSCWAGLSMVEANPRCWVDGQGYGNSWNMTIQQSFVYPGSGSVTLSFAYRVDAEAGYDYLNVVIDTTGTGQQYDLVLTSYTGIVSGTATFTLTPHATMRSTPGPITIKFNVTSDGAYSDEDGQYTTTCGHSAIDDVALSGAITTPVATFEAGDDGWLQRRPYCGYGSDWSNLRALGTLPPPLSFCACAMSDTVMVFADSGGAHNLTCADNLAVSPWIDLKAGGDVGRPGKIIQFDGYFELPLTNYVFVQAAAQWYPFSCASGYVTTSIFKSDGSVRYYGGVPTCTLPGNPTRIDYSAVIPPSAEQVRIAIGVLNYCCYLMECYGTTNSTPWFDNIRLGVYGTAGAPFISMRTIDEFQDAFSADGTLNPASTARVDVNSVKGAAHPAPGTALGDTLVVLGDGGNQEVRVVFHVRPGPFTNAGALAAWAGARWTSEPSLGAGWYSARMDSAEQGGTRSNPVRWMGTLHEQDPKFGGGVDTDRGAEGDINQLSHDIFPDHLLTPGSRIDYFVKARYLPPDPRNPGGTSWFVLPDTTGGNFLEMEMLPSSMAADSTWNCTLLVDHHADRDVGWGQLEEAGLTTALGGGGANAEGTRYDRYDVNASTSGQASLGRPLNTQYGAAAQQLIGGYQTIVWHSGSNSSFNLVDEDAAVLTPWLVGSYVTGHRFWGTGDGLVRSMATENEPTTLSFLNGVLGVRYACDTIRLAGCPTGSALDSTYCLPLANVAGAEFSAATPGSVRGNGCPSLRSYDLIGRDISTPTARGQLDYLKNGLPVSFASVTHRYEDHLDFRTVVDGFANGGQRDLGGNPHLPSSCAGTSAVGQRAALVLGWLQGGLTGACRFPGDECLGCDPVGGVPDEGAAIAVRLLRATPNPTAGATDIGYTLGPRPGAVRLQLFDISGRLVRTLVDGSQEPGPHSAAWDVRDASGRLVPAGLYFYRLAANGVIRTERIVVRR